MPLPVRSVIAPPQDPQKQIPVSKVGPLTARGGIHRGLRAFSAAWTALQNEPDRPLPMTGKLPPPEELKPRWVEGDIHEAG